MVERKSATGFWLDLPALQRNCLSDDVKGGDVIS